MQKKLSVLFLCGWYPSRVLPTNGDFIERHAKAVAKLNNVSVIHIITDENLVAKEEIIVSKEENLITYLAYVKPQKNGFLKALTFYKVFKKIYSKIDSIDVVHLNEIYPFGIFSLYLKKRFNKPYIISEHWTVYHQPQAKNISFFQKKISNLITKSAEYVCPVSNDLADSLKKIPLKGNYTKVPNVVNTELFFPLEKKEERFTIIHISNMINEHKNVEGILHVISKLQLESIDFCLKLIGDNSIKYIDFAKKLGIDSKNIEFINQIPHKEIATHLQKADVFVLFSNYENLPCVILEAFSCGVPVISTNVGGIKEYFPENFGTLISKNNEELLLKEILNIYYKKHKIADKQIMHQYVKNNFSELVIANSFNNLYQKAVKNIAK